MLPTTIPSTYPHSIFFKKAQLCQTQQLPWILFRDSGALRLQAPYTTVTKGVCLKKKKTLTKSPPGSSPSPKGRPAELLTPHAANAQPRGHFGNT